MRTIRISTEVWEAIASRGNFGETPDDVLRREFAIRRVRRRGTRTRIPRQTSRRMSPRIENGHLVVEFKGGASRRLSLPAQSDKLAIRKVRDTAVAFAVDNRATPGQVAAVKKALTDNGYHVAK